MTKKAIILSKPFNKMSSDERKRALWMKDFFQVYSHDENGNLLPIEELLECEANQLVVVTQDENGKKPRHNGRG